VSDPRRALPGGPLLTIKVAAHKHKLLRVALELLAREMRDHGLSPDPELEAIRVSLADPDVYRKARRRAVSAAYMRSYRRRPRPVADRADVA
jgi:hypothetical protein